MDTVLLRSFLTVAELASFTDAAHTLGIAQSTLTARIQRLEADLGAPLFDRTSAKTELTAAGRSYTVYAQRILRVLHEGRQAVASAALLASSRVRVMTSHVPAATAMPALVRELQPRGGIGDVPTVELSVGTSKRVFRHVRDGQVDVGVTNLHFSHPDVTAEVVAEQGLVLVHERSTGHRDAAPLDRLPLYFYEEELEDALRMESVCNRIGVPFARAIGIRDTGVLTTLVSAGLGAGLLPRALVVEELVTGRLVEHADVAADDLPRQVTCVLVRRETAESAVTPAIRSFVALARDHLRVPRRGAAG